MWRKPLRKSACALLPSDKCQGLRVLQSLQRSREERVTRATSPSSKLMLASGDCRPSLLQIHYSINARPAKMRLAELAGF